MSIVHVMTSLNRNLPAACCHVHPHRYRSTCSSMLPISPFILRWDRQGPGARCPGPNHLWIFTVPLSTAVCLQKNSHVPDILAQRSQGEPVLASKVNLLQIPIMVLSQKEMAEMNSERHAKKWVTLTLQKIMGWLNIPLCPLGWTSLDWFMEADREGCPTCQWRVQTAVRHLSFRN